MKVETFSIQEKPGARKQEQLATRSQLQHAEVSGPRAQECGTVTTRPSTQRRAQNAISTYTVPKMSTITNDQSFKSTLSGPNLR